MLIYVGKCSDPVCGSYNFCDKDICLNFKNISYVRSAEVLSVMCCVIKFESVGILYVLLVVL